MAGAPDNLLPPRIHDSLDHLLTALSLRREAPERFRVESEPGRLFGRVYGGQLLGQALIAASATVEGKAPHSLHAAFVQVGAPGEPVELAVDRVRDGRSVATRRITVVQHDRVLLVAIASFHANPSGPDVGTPPPAASRPDDLPLLQEWAERMPMDTRAQGRHWIDAPPPVEIRMAEPPTFLGGSPGDGLRSHWMRVPRDVGDDPALHAALVAYASDFFLMDMVFRAHPDGSGPGRFGGFSLDHALWLHRPTRFDRWHVHTQESLTVIGDRGLARGVIHDVDGVLVATVMQEVLIRPLATS